jgi:hypothetical protein
MPRNSRIYFTILLLVLAPLANNALADQNGSKDKHKQEQNHCIREIITHPFTNAQYPELLTNRFVTENTKVLKEIDSFCQCTIKNRNNELKLKKVDELAWKFRDRKIQLDQEDQCAQAKFSDNILNLFYAITVSTRITAFLESRLRDRMPASARVFASQKSVQAKNTCMQDAILKKCTRVKSLRNTYRCVEQIMANPRKIDLFGQSCPTFHHRDNDIFDLSDRKDMI